MANGIFLLKSNCRLKFNVNIDFKKNNIYLTRTY